MTDSTQILRRRESAETLLAKNLVAARLAEGWTQDALSAASGISRATIAQLETGVSDPRLSTLDAIAKAFRLPLLMLLIGELEVRAISQLMAKPAVNPVSLALSDVRQVQRLINTGMLRDRAQAVRLVAHWVGEKPNVQPLVILIAALFAGFVPDPGVTAGAALGEQIEAELRNGPG